MALFHEKFKFLDKNAVENEIFPRELKVEFQINFKFHFAQQQKDSDQKPLTTKAP